MNLYVRTVSKDYRASVDATYPPIMGPRTGPINGDMVYTAIGLGGIRCDDTVHAICDKRGDVRCNSAIVEQVAHTSARDTEERRAAEPGEEAEDQVDGYIWM